MDPALLADLEHANLIEAFSAAAAQVPGALVRHADGVVLFASGLPARLFNQVLVAEGSASPEAIAEAVDLMRDRGEHFIVSLRSGRDDRLLPQMGALGLAPVSAAPWMPGMALHPLPPAGSVPAPDGFRIDRVGDARGVATMARVAAEGFGMPLEMAAAMVTDALLVQPEASIYLGYAAGAAVTCGLGFRTGRTIGIYDIATVPAARGRGYGAAITMRLVDDGLAAGCDVAILQASDMGFAIYERLGFRTVVEYVGFVEPEH
jgi:GNAT superfamily N-acetyltransferase